MEFKKMFMLKSIKNRQYFIYLFFPGYAWAEFLKHRLQDTGHGIKLILDKNN